MTGILAIFNDCKAGREAEFDAWFQGEHLVERLGVPGFLFGRRHEAIAASSAYFNYYVVESPAVLTSKPYLERLDNPTPMTKRIMSEVFINMNRTVCNRVARRGAFRGSYVVTARYFNAAPDTAALDATLDALVKDPRVAGGEIWQAVDPAGMPVSEEERLRGGDRKIKGALAVDTLRQADAEKLAARLSEELAGADIGLYRVLCSLGCDPGT
ncbi:MAG: hypothetical protein ACK4UO_04300 [Pseudolabrys sp.]